MNQESNRTTFATGKFISEGAVRGALGRGRRSGREHAVAAPRPAATAVVRRRWSVAELIRAAAVAPRTGNAH